MALWSLKRRLPEPDQLSGVTAAVTVFRERFRLTVESGGVGAFIEVSFGGPVNLPRMSEPMRAAIREIPSKPSPLAAIADSGARAHGEREESLADLRHLRRVVATLKDLSYLSPSILESMDSGLDTFRERSGLDDDDLGGQQ
jgi:hypothetical protein